MITHDEVRQLWEMRIRDIVSAITPAVAIEYEGADTKAATDAKNAKLPWVRVSIQEALSVAETIAPLRNSVKSKEGVVVVSIFTRAGKGTSQIRTIAEALTEGLALDDPYHIRNFPVSIQSPTLFIVPNDESAWLNGSWTFTYTSAGI